MMPVDPRQEMKLRLELCQEEEVQQDSLIATSLQRSTHRYSQTQGLSKAELSAITLEPRPTKSLGKSFSGVALYAEMIRLCLTSSTLDLRPLVHVGGSQLLVGALGS
jgi:hypothetical protein